MPEHIPHETLQAYATGLGLDMAVLVAFDGAITHVVTWGKTTEDSDVAAQGGDRVKHALGWPKKFLLPSRVSAMEKLLEESLSALHHCAELERMVDEEGNDTPGHWERKHYNDVLFTINALRADRGEPPLEEFSPYPAELPSGSGGTGSAAAAAPGRAEGGDTETQAREQGQDGAGETPGVVRRALDERDDLIAFRVPEGAPSGSLNREYFDATTKLFTSGIAFEVMARVLFQGDPYGLSFCLRHTGKPVVEFYDVEHDHTRYSLADHDDAVRAGAPMLGQFVSRYYIETLLEGEQDRGLCLHGGVPKWNISAECMNEIRAWLRTF